MVRTTNSEVVMSKTVMLIHGAWLSPLSWEGFRERYEARGYTVIAPSWPYDERPVPELQRDPRPELAKVGIKDVVDHYEKEIRKLDAPPILIGHSFGGLFVQLLLDRGLGSAGVAIDPAPPRGIIARPSVIVSSLSVFLTINGWNRVLRMSLKDFSRYFAQTLPESEKPAMWARYIVPTPGRPFFQAAFGIQSGLNWKNPNRAPLLLTLADLDKTVAAPMVRDTYRKHLRSPVLTELKEFTGRSHFLCIEKGWEEVADYALAWAEQHRAEQHAR
jgi:pimeloyl-ACP methyl ester carboxylesterase